jgi:hypothetical protein
MYDKWIIFKILLNKIYKITISLKNKIDEKFEYFVDEGIDKIIHRVIFVKKRQRYRIWTDTIYYIPEKIKKSYIFFIPYTEWVPIGEMRVIRTDRDSLIDWFLVNNLIHNISDLDKDCIGKKWDNDNKIEDEN